MRPSSRTLVRTLAAAMLAAGCSDGPSGPDKDPSLSLRLAPAATDPVTMRVLGRVDRVRVQVWSNGVHLDSVFAVTPKDGAVQWVWSLPPTLADGEMELYAEAYMGDTLLFAAAGYGSINKGVASAAFRALEPGAYIRIDPIPTLGLNDTVPQSGAVVFGTGDTIPGAQITWGVRNSMWEPPVLGGILGPPRVIGLCEGSARVVAGQLGGVAYAEQWVGVRSRVVALTIAPDSVDLRPGEKARLTMTARDRRGTVVPRSYTWTSSDTAVATVQSGEVTAKAPGRITVTATLQEPQVLTATAVVRVLPEAGTGGSVPHR